MQANNRELLYRGEGFEACLDKKITVGGAGSLGSLTVDALARMGFRSIKVIDRERVDIANVSTQLYGHEDIGTVKVDALRQRTLIDAQISIEPMEKNLDPSSAHKLLRGSDLVIDCFDNHDARQALYDYCKEKGINSLHMGVAGGYAEVEWQATYIVPENHSTDDLDDCANPMSRSLALIVAGVASDMAAKFLHGKSIDQHKKFSGNLSDLNFGTSRMAVRS